MSVPAYYSLLGVELPPLRQFQSGIGRQAQLLQNAVSSGQAPNQPMRVPSPITIYADASGDEVAVLPTSGGPSRLPWIRGSAVDVQDASVAQEGGFVSKASFENGAQPWSEPLGGGPTQRQLALGALKVLEEMGLLASLRAASGGKPQTSSGNPQASGLRAASTAEPPAPAQQAPQPPVSRLEAIGNKIKENKPYITAGMGVLGNIVAEGTLKPSMITSGLLSAATGLGMQALESAVMGLMGDAPDENSSTAEWAASLVGPMLLKQYLSMGNLDKWLGQGPDKPLALREGDFEDKLNHITAGLPSVLIEHLPAARENDPIEKSGVKVMHGAKTVLIGTQHAGRRGPDGSRNVPGDDFKSSARRTQIGGPSTNPNPPKPAGMNGLPEKRNPKQGDDRPTERTAVLMDGEWRIYDPEMGYNATQAELENLPDWGPFASIFKAGTKPEGWFGMPEKAGNWYLFGGLIDLGSPEWPGAGTGSTWFVPDTLFGYKMSPYYALHDWLFRPGDPALAGDFWAVFKGSEIPAFLNSVSWDPVQFLLSIAYVSATTTQAFLTWLDNTMQTIDENLGFPDKYGHLPHLRHKLAAGGAKPATKSNRP